MPRAKTPLASYAVLRTADVDHARASISASLAPHRLTPLGSVADFQVIHNAACLRHLSFHYIDYGSEVEVDVDGMDFQLVQVPLAGTATFSVGSRSVTATPRVAAVTAPNESLRMRYSAGNPRLLVQVSTGLLLKRLAVACGSGTPLPRVHGATLDVTRGRGRSWRSLLEVVLSDLERDEGLASASLAASSLEFAVVDGLIASLAGPSQSEHSQRTPHERLIDRAARLLDEHCAEPLGAADIAEAVGLSVRSLQAGFRAYRDTTPMAYLRHVRLVRVHEALSDGTAGSVTEAATRWGVTHLGRLSADYRNLFGETPSETLHRSW